MSLNLLAKPSVVSWCYRPATADSLINTSDPKKLKVANQVEKDWARSILGGAGNQWTTQLCQEIVREVLIAIGRKNVRNGSLTKGSFGKKSYQPDLESDEFVYEVKGRSWTTPGTAGEKILGVPLKYGELPELLHKPLRIILVGYQEFEARNHYAFGDLLDEANQTKQLNDSLNYFSEHKIQYIGLTDLLKTVNQRLKT